MGGVCAAPLPVGLVPLGNVRGVPAALAVVMGDSDLRPSMYPIEKNTEQIATSPKNRNSSLPVPSVISVSCDEAIVQLQHPVRRFQPLQIPAFAKRQPARRAMLPMLLYLPHRP